MVFNLTGSNKQKKNNKTMVNKAELAPNKTPRKDKTVAKSSENLRTIPKDVIQTFTTDVIGGILDSFTRQLLGQPLVSSETVSARKMETNQEALMWKKKFQLAERRRREEKAFFEQKKREQEERIVSIRQALQLEVVTFTQGMAAWAKEVEVASFQAPVSPSVYHEHFFEKLISFVKNIKARINRSKRWLHVQNTKAAKMKGLWGLAQKKGGSFNQEILFSEERAVAFGG